MDETRVEAFLQAVSTGSFSAAARAMGYTPAGVLRLVDALESELGVTLLERTSRGVVPTRAGEALVPDLRELTVLSGRVKGLAAEIASPDRGTVRLGSARSLAAHWLAPAIARFGDRHPGVTVQLREGATPELARWLTAREVDVCVGGPQQGRSWTYLGESRYVALVPREHPFARRPFLHLSDFDREPLVQIRPGRGTDTARLMAEEGVEPDVRFSTADIETAKAMVGAGIGICLTIDLAGPVEAFGAVMVPMAAIDPFRFGVVHRGEGSLSAATTAFVEELVSLGA
ncbi:LysR family transcriptional regulator [Caniella muris]|uniref:LysR family transcriptional regulator n=1 Tax=Caniella muris TaxID=2941502 RepID=UPI0020411B12|nr:LysR family transcriptional regulator [Caniella muris]